MITSQGRSSLLAAMVAAKEAEAAAVREQLARMSLTRTTSSSALGADTDGAQGQREWAQRTPSVVYSRMSPATAWEQLNGSVAALREFMLEHQLQLADRRGDTETVSL